jgi:hypothetical protein
MSTSSSNEKRWKFSQTSRCAVVILSYPQSRAEPFLQSVYWLSPSSWKRLPTRRVVPADKLSTCGSVNSANCHSRLPHRKTLDRFSTNCRRRLSRMPRAGQVSNQDYSYRNPKTQLCGPLLREKAASLVGITMLRIRSTTCGHRRLGKLCGLRACLLIYCEGGRV